MPKAVYGTQSPPRIDDLSIWVDPANKRCTKLDYSTLYPRYKVTGYTEIPNTITCLKSALTNENNDINYGFEARLGVVNSFTGKWHYSMGTGLDYHPDSYGVNPGGRHKYYTTSSDSIAFEHTTGNPDFYPYTSPGHFNFPYPLVLPDIDISSSLMAKKGINAMEDLYFERIDSMSSSSHPKIFSRQTKIATSNGIPSNIDGRGLIEGEYDLEQLTASHGSLDKMITRSSRLEFPSHSIVSQNSAFMIKVRRFLSIDAQNQNQDAPIEVRRGHNKHLDKWDVNGAFSYPNEHHINLEGQIINLSTFYNQTYGVNSTTPNTFRYNEDRSQIGEIVEVGPIIDSDDRYFYHGIKSVNSQADDGKNRTGWPEPTWAFDAYRNPVLPLELEDSLKQNPDQLDPAPARMFTLTYQGTVTEDHPEADGNTSGGQYDYHNEIADPGTFMFWHKDAKQLLRYNNSGKIFLHNESGSIGSKQHGIFNSSTGNTFNDNILLHKDDCDFNNPSIISWQANPRTLYVYKKSTGELMLIVRRSQNNEHMYQNDLYAAADGWATPNRDMQSTELTGFEAGEYNANNGDFRLFKLFRSAHAFNVGEEYVFVDIIDGYNSGPQERRNFLVSPIKHHQPDFYPGAFRFFGSKDDHTENGNGKGIQFNKRIDNTNELEHFTMCQWVRTNWLKGQQVSPAFSVPVTGEDKIRWRYADTDTWEDEYGYPYHEKDHMPSTFSIGEQLMAFPSPYGISGWPSKQTLGTVSNVFASNAPVQSISPFLTDQQRLILGAKTLIVYEQENYSTGENGIIFHSLYVSNYPTHAHNPMVRRNTSDDTTLIENAGHIAQKFTTLESVKANLPGFINDYVKDDGQAWIDITINQGEELKIIHIKSSDLTHGRMRTWKKGKEFAPNGQIYRDLVYYWANDSEFSWARLDVPNHSTNASPSYHSMGAHLKERSDKFYISPEHSTGYTTLTETNNSNKKVCGSITIKALGGEDDLNSKAGCFCIQLGCQNGSEAPWSDFPVVVAQSYTNPSQSGSGSMPLWRHTSNKRIADNNWHHVAVTYSNSTTGTGQCKIYIDGQLDATYTSDNYPNIGFPGNYSDAPHLRIGGVPENFYEQTNDHPADSSVFTAGHRFDRSTVGFRGEIGPTHFYDDVALNSTEINEIYSSLKGRFIFND